MLIQGTPCSAKVLRAHPMYSVLIQCTPFSSSKYVHHVHAINGVFATYKPLQHAIAAPGIPCKAIATTLQRHCTNIKAPLQGISAKSALNFQCTFPPCLQLSTQVQRCLSSQIADDFVNGICKRRIRREFLYEILLANILLANILLANILLADRHIAGRPLERVPFHRICQ